MSQIKMFFHYKMTHLGWYQTSFDRKKCTQPVMTIQMYTEPVLKVQMYTNPVMTVQMYTKLMKIGGFGVT